MYFQKKPENSEGEGVHDYGILRAWGGGVTHFGISEGKGGFKIWKPSVVGYGYFLELPILVKYHFLNYLKTKFIFNINLIAKQF